MNNVVKKIAAVTMAFTLLGTGTVAVKSISPKFDNTLSASAANYTKSYWNYTRPSSGRCYSRYTSNNKSQVKWIQAALNFYFNTNLLDVDGSYGPATESAVILFQSRNNLSADGIYGPNTHSTLLYRIYY